MSLDEFLAWNPGGHETWQLVGGVPVAMAPASTVHGKLLGRLAQAVENHLDAQNSTCSLVIEPGVVPHLLASHNYRVPDLAVTCAEIEARQPTLTDPVLVAEILSPSNQSETWDNVLAYATIPTVQEILVLRWSSWAPTCCAGSPMEAGRSKRSRSELATSCWTASGCGRR